MIFICSVKFKLTLTHADLFVYLFAALLGQIGIIFRRPDGSLIIPNADDMQMHASPESIVRSWSNASQIETVRIEHTKVSPVSIGNIGPKQEEPKPANISSKVEKAQLTVKGKFVDKESKDNEGAEIEMEVERSGDGEMKDFNVIDYNGKGSRKTGTNSEYGAGSLLNLRAKGIAGQNSLKIGPINSRFSEDKAENDQVRKLSMEESSSTKPRTKGIVSSQESSDLSHGRKVLGGMNPKLESGDDQVDVTVFFDNNSDKDFDNEVSKLKSASKSKKHRKFSSLRKNHGTSDFTIEKVKTKPVSAMSSKNLEGHFFSLPVGTVMQPSDAEEEENPDEEENSRSKGEIPEGDIEEDDEKDSTTTNMYDMREALPFFSMPVTDQHGYSLIAPVFDPYQDSPYQAGLDLVSAEEGAAFIDDENEFYEPQPLKHTWKRSLQESLPMKQKLSSIFPQVAGYSRHDGKNGARPLRRKREISQHAYFPENRKLTDGFRSSVGLKPKRVTGISSARKRFAELVRKVHERSVEKRRLLGHESIPAGVFGRHTLLSENRNFVRPKASKIRSVIPGNIGQQLLVARSDSYPSVGNGGNTRSRRRRRSIDETETSAKSGREELARNRLLDTTVYREKRDKIIDDYDGDGSDDFENEPHVVKRSAIFGSLESSSASENDANVREEKIKEDPRIKRQVDEESEEEGEDSEGERRQLASERRVSSLEENLRKKLLSMKTQSRSVLKLLKRVHQDISGGNTEDLFKLEAEIADIEKRGKEKIDKLSNTEESSSRKSNSHKKKEKHKSHEKSKEKLKAKSITPDIQQNAWLKSDSDIDVGTLDSGEEQEKLAFKQNPDEYLKYGAGNTGVLESWTLVFYGT